MAVGDCQEFDGLRDPDGYGRLWLTGHGVVKAHRIAWALHNGADPTGLVVRHKCDNRACVNPEHLEIGSQSDNVRDMDERRRRASQVGQNNANSVLTNEVVVKIRSLLEQGVRQKALALRFGISQVMVSRIKHRKAWKHV